MHDVYLLLGTNIGKRKDNILFAENEIENRIAPVLKKSGIYESKAWGYNSENSFLNRTILINTEISPLELLLIIKQIERSMGRIKTSMDYEDRLIDIDILFYGDQIINEKDLIIPHPRMHLRNFTLKPLAEINGNFIHPVIHKSINQLLTDCADTSEVEKYFS